MTRQEAPTASGAEPLAPLAMNDVEDAFLADVSESERELPGRRNLPPERLGAAYCKPRNRPDEAERTAAILGCLEPRNLVCRLLLTPILTATGTD